MSTLSQFLGGAVTGSFDLEIVTDNFILDNTVNDLGSYSSGGHIICKSGGTAWIIAPRSSEVCRRFVSRNDAIATANAVSSPFTGWFIPSVTQLQNPGAVCGKYWDSIPPCFSKRFWSNTCTGTNCAFTVRVGLNETPNCYARAVCCRCYYVRAFRCVTY